MVINVALVIFGKHRRFQHPDRQDTMRPETVRGRAGMPSTARSESFEAVDVHGVARRRSPSEQARRHRRRVVFLAGGDGVRRAPEHPAATGILRDELSRPIGHLAARTGAECGVGAQGRWLNRRMNCCCSDLVTNSKESGNSSSRSSTGRRSNSRSRG